MVFKKTTTTNIKLTLPIDQVVIDRVDNFNFLGLTIDSQMTWKKHTNNISNKCLRVIGTLNRIKHIIITHSNSSYFVQFSYIASYKLLYNGLGVSE